MGGVHPTGTSSLRSRWVAASHLASIGSSRPLYCGAGRLSLTPFSLSSSAEKKQRGRSSPLLFHQSGDDDTREEGQQPNGRDGPSKADDCSEQTSGERTDCVAQVAPEPVDTKGAGTPSRIGSIGHRCEQARIHHRGADPEQDAAEKPPSEAVKHGDEEEPDRLNPHSGGDETFTPPPVAERAGYDL